MAIADPKFAIVETGTHQSIVNEVVADSHIAVQVAMGDRGNSSENHALSSWRTFEVPTFHGQYDTNIDNGEDYHSLKLGALLGLLPTIKPKANAPAFIPSIYNAFDARNHAVQRGKGGFVALTGDIDKGNVPMADIIDYTRALFGPDVAIFIYSTGSATPEDKRWRIIVPLQEPVSFKRWNEAQEAFFTYMEAKGVLMDGALARAAQPVYLPNVPPERRDENGEPLFYETYLTGEMAVFL